MLIYFHIDEIARDGVVASGLRQELKKSGGDVVYGNRFTSRLIPLLNIFDFVIFPSLQIYQHYFPDSEELPDNIVILPSEAVGAASGNPKRINAKYFGNDAKASAPWHLSIREFLLWGYKHKCVFEQDYPEYLSKTAVVGHPRLDRRCFKASDDRKRHTGPKKVGLITRFNLLNPFSLQNPVASIYGGMRKKNRIIPQYANSPDKNVEDVFYTEAIDVRLFLEIIETLSPCSDIELSLRIHPRENRKTWVKLIQSHGFKAEIARWDAPFSEWLSDMDLLISPPSTSFYEILLAGRVPICTSEIVKNRADHTLTESDNNNQILKYVDRPKSIEELVSMVMRTDVEKIDKYAVLNSGVKRILLEQTAVDIADCSLTNIHRVLREKKNPENQSLCQSCLKYLFIGCSVVLNYGVFFKRLISFRSEQSSSFALTIRRVRNINNLAIRS